MSSKLLLGLAAALVSAALAHAQVLPPPPPPPAGNPITQAKINLGKTLFWDEQLSSTNTMACGTCHISGSGGSDPRTLSQAAASRHPGFDSLFQTPDDVLGSPGVARATSRDTFALDPAFRMRPQVSSRRSMSAINALYSPLLFWDGRADGTFEDPVSGALLLNGGAALESQAAGPVVSGVEMGHDGVDWSSVAARLAPLTPLRLSPSVPAQLANYINGRKYDQLFAEAFGSSQVTPARIVMAIATYERILVANQAPVSLPIGSPGSQLTQQELAGRQIFNGPGRCNVCHGGPLFTDNQFHYTGVRPQFEDLGRFGVTGAQGDRGRMRTPSLLNVELRAPYFHNGGAATLEAVVDFYDRGGDFNAPNKALAVAPIGLTQQQKDALVAFLRRPLNDPRVASQSAPFDRPQLYSESAFTPDAFGAPTAGAGGIAPQIFAIEPPAWGNSSWTVGIDRGNGGRTAVLLVGPVGGHIATPFQGAQLYVAWNHALTQRLRYGALNGVGAGQGWASMNVDLPSDPLLAGTPLYAQWVVVDPDGLGRRLAASAAVEMLIY
jgi:cytochrome c peroxidase